MATAIFNCKTCKVGKRIEYPESRRNHTGYGHYEAVKYRLGEIVNAGWGQMKPREIHPWQEATCEKCGSPMKWGWLIGYKREEVPCDARCTGARKWHCECSCGGKNHGSAWTNLGKRLKDVVQQVA